MLAPISSHAPATPTAANDSIGKMEEAINESLGKMKEAFNEAIERQEEIGSRRESMSYMEAVRIIRDGVESGAIGTIGKMPEVGLGYDNEGGTPHITRYELEALSAVYQLFGAGDTSQVLDSFTRLETAKRDEGLDTTDSSRLIPEDGQLSREDLEIFAGDTNNYLVDDTPIERVAEAWDDLHFRRAFGTSEDPNEITVGYDKVAEKAKFGEAADVLLERWDNAERTTDFNGDYIANWTILDGMSELEVSLDTAGPANAEFEAEHELDFPAPDHVYSLADFNAYLGE